MQEQKFDSPPQPMDFTPTPQKPIAPPPPEYVLTTDVTGEEPVQRGVQTLYAVTQNEKGEQIKVKFKAPFAPKAKCKRCYGRGYVGFMVDSGNIIPCRKCYPML